MVRAIIFFAAIQLFCTAGMHSLRGQNTVILTDSSVAFDLPDGLPSGEELSVTVDLLLTNFGLNAHLIRLAVNETSGYDLEFYNLFFPNVFTPPCPLAPLRIQNEPLSDLLDAAVSTGYFVVEGLGVLSDGSFAPGSFLILACDENSDTDEDGSPDVVDLFPLDPDETQDNDGDGIGDNADTDDDNDGLSDSDEVAQGTDPLNPDSDMDGVPDGEDNCGLTPNTDQADSNNDGIGDACSPSTGDSDGDGISDEEDRCPETEPGVPVNASGCSIEQLCPCDLDWKSHGEYVVCVIRNVFGLYEQGRISRKEKKIMIRDAAGSDCGKKN